MTTQRKDQRRPKVEIVPQFFEYIRVHTEKDSHGGKRHFLRVLQDQGKNVPNEVLNILEDSWIKGRSDTSLGKKYDCSSDSIYRLRHDLEPLKDNLIAYLSSTVQTNRFYIEETDSSDYDSVVNYIRRARRDGLKHYKTNVKDGQERLDVPKVQAS